MKNIRAIIWDWNGTLLNDVEFCLKILNKLLIENQLKPLDIKEYKEIFTFPVKDYYQKAGFNFNKKSFEELGKIFIDDYEKNKFSLSLYDGAVELLNYFQSTGIEQYLLSAYKQEKLEEILNYFNIKKYFKIVKGLNNIYASGKTELGISLRKEIKFKNEQVLLIGDTLHDKEVANSINVQCILISKGHQSDKILRSNGALVIDDIRILKKLLVF